MTRDTVGIGLLGVLFALCCGALTGWWDLGTPISHTRTSDWDFQLTLFEAVGRNLALGQLPFWNPWTAGGVPLWANPEAPVLHPTAWLSAWVHPATAMRLGLLLHLGVLGAGMAALGRRLGASWPALVVTLLVLMGSDFLFWRLGRGHAMMVLACWIPVALAVLAGPGAAWRRGVLAGGCIALMAWGGAPYPAWIGALALVAWTGVRLLGHAGLAGSVLGAALGWVLGAGGGPWVQVLLVAVGAGLLGWRWRPKLQGRVVDELVALGLAGASAALLAAPRWWVTAEALAGSHRLRLPVEPRGSASFGFPEFWDATFGLGHVLAGLAALGLDLGGGAADLRLGGGHEGMPAVFTPLVAALAVAGAWRLRHRPELLGTGLFALALAFAHNLKPNLYALVHAMAPLDRFQNPERHAFVWVPLLALLAGLGAQQLVGTRRWRWALLGPVLALHGLIAIPLAIERTNIAQVTPDEYRRQGAGPPVWFREGTVPPSTEPRTHDHSTNFELAGRNIGCMNCGDAMQHDPPAELEPGPWALTRGGAEGDSEGSVEVSWTPGRVSFEAEDPGLYRFDEAMRPGWTAAGAELVLDAPVLTVDVASAGPVEVGYRPPGLLAALLALLGGLGLLAFALVPRSRLPRP